VVEDAYDYESYTHTHTHTHAHTHTHTHTHRPLELRYNEMNANPHSVTSPLKQWRSKIFNHHRYV